MFTSFVAGNWATYCTCITFLLYNFSYSKAFIKNYERVSSETTESNMCFVFYCL